MGNLSPNNSCYQIDPRDEEMPNLNDPQVSMAAVKIQSAYRGFQTRTTHRRPNGRPAAAADETDLPDLKSAEVGVPIWKILTG